MDTEPVATPTLASVVGTSARIFDLGRPLRMGMPQSPNHPAYWHAHPRRHGDVLRPDGGSAANDMISMGTHVGTHIDALSHVSQNGLLFDDVDAITASQGGRFSVFGAETIEPMFCRGLLLDVPMVLGLDECEAGYEITPADLDRCCAVQGVEASAGDVILVRSGWGARFSGPDPASYVGGRTGVPGVSTAGARWLANAGPRAVGADTIAFERIEPGQGHAVLPAHRVLLVEQGIYIIESLDLDALSAAGVHEFLFVLSPLPLVGATGSPVRPLAITW